MTYSIVIPSYNSEQTILRCLEALCAQEFNERYEIIVADSSTDATPDLIRQDFPQVKLIHFPQRTDAGTARNAGIQQAQGEILCLIDSDCLAAPDWLRRIAAAHAEQQYAAVGGAVLNANPESWAGWAGYLAEFREFFPHHPRHTVPHIATCNISYRRETFERYGRFLPNFYPQEDLVFNLGVTQAGESILFDPAIRVAHINKTSVRHFLRHQYRIGAITAQVLKHFPQLSGSRIARSRSLSLMAAPVLPFVKFLRTFRVAAAVSAEYRRAFLTVSPLLLPGLLIWGSGFLAGALRPALPLPEPLSPPPAANLNRSPSC